MVAGCEDDDLCFGDDVDEAVLVQSWYKMQYHLTAASSGGRAQPADLGQVLWLHPVGGT
jgi:hypothetical protein